VQVFSWTESACLRVPALAGCNYLFLKDALAGLNVSRFLGNCNRPAAKAELPSLRTIQGELGHRAVPLRVVDCRPGPWLVQATEPRENQEYCPSPGARLTVKYCAPFILLPPWNAGTTREQLVQRIKEKVSADDTFRADGRDLIATDDTTAPKGALVKKVLLHWKSVDCHEDEVAVSPGAPVFAGDSITIVTR